MNYESEDEVFVAIPHRYRGKEMTISPWIVVLIFLIGISIPVVTYLITKYKREKYTCVTCGKYHQESFKFAQCPTCKKMICRDNLEKIEEAHTKSTVTREVVPARRDPAFPCGTEFTYAGIAKRHVIYCKKDTPRFKFGHTIRRL